MSETSHFHLPDLFHGPLAERLHVAHLGETLHFPHLAEILHHHAQIGHPPAPTRPLQAPSAPPAHPAVDAAEASRKRMAYVIAFVKEPGKPEFTNRTVVFRVVTEERTYQLQLISQLEAAKAHASDDASKADLDHRLTKAHRVQLELYALLKDLTGIHHQTGGENFKLPAQEAVGSHPHGLQTLPDAKRVEVENLRRAPHTGSLGTDSLLTHAREAPLSLPHGSPPLKGQP